MGGAKYCEQECLEREEGGGKGRRGGDEEVMANNNIQDMTTLECQV